LRRRRRHGDALRRRRVRRDARAWTTATGWPRCCGASPVRWSVRCRSATPSRACS
jgi:hypothetical protein